tara:strand:- start:355 stop:957 length:603 start_codon:yes stop_codon:yes gene_type:complete
MKEFYFYCEKKINNTINEMFIEFEVRSISAEKIKKNNFINQNILLIIEGDFIKNFNESFFINNNVVIIFEKNINFNNKNIFETKVFNKPINLNKFIDEVTTFFVEKSFNYQDIKIVGEKIINNETEKEIYLTALEKDIFILLIDQEQIERKFFLERILKIKKDTQTRTIETHFTRIRNKLSKIDSKLKIISKGDKVFLTH